jgi:hypothetical protein
MTALHYVQTQITYAIRNDAGLIVLFNSGVPQISMNLNPNNQQFPFIVYRLRLQTAYTDSDMRNGTLYFSVYDFNRDVTRAEAIADRISKIFNKTDFQDLSGVCAAIRTFQCSGYDFMPTDNVDIQRVDVGIPIRFLDVAAQLEKIAKNGG